ncbi:hypothetical protein V5799_011990 [Amblyomma americanum]|uniref:Uncharacterized protein n=1 Tax=Amblyomma americanum TaxID=6943 RepID=A0AAQ4EFS6_AMBAM
MGAFPGAPRGKSGSEGDLPSPRHHPRRRRLHRRHADCHQSAAGRPSKPGSILEPQRILRDEHHDHLRRRHEDPCGRPSLPGVLSRCLFLALLAAASEGGARAAGGWRVSSGRQWISTGAVAAHTSVRASWCKHCRRAVQRSTCLNAMCCGTLHWCSEKPLPVPSKVPDTPLRAGAGGGHHCSVCCVAQHLS